MSLSFFFLAGWLAETASDTLFTKEVIHLRVGSKRER